MLVRNRLIDHFFIAKIAFIADWCFLVFGNNLQVAYIAQTCQSFSSKSKWIKCLQVADFREFRSGKPFAEQWVLYYRNTTSIIRNLHISESSLLNLNIDLCRSSIDGVLSELFDDYILLFVPLYGRCITSPAAILLITLCSSLRIILILRRQYYYMRMYGCHRLICT